MVIRIWPEADLLNNGLLSVTFDLLHLLLLFVNKLVIVYHFTNRRDSIRRDFNKVQLLLLRYCQGVSQRVHTLLQVITDKANFLSYDELINVVFGFLFLKRWPW